MQFQCDFSKAGELGLPVLIVVLTNSLLQELQFSRLVFIALGVGFVTHFLAINVLHDLQLKVQSVQMTMQPPHSITQCYQKYPFPQLFQQ